MLFNSWQFILVFLPISFFLHFWLNHKRLLIAGKVCGRSKLVLLCLLGRQILPLILVSILLNFAIGTRLVQAHQKSLRLNYRKIVLTTGIMANLLLLGYYKYTDFLLSNVNVVFGKSYALPHIVLPLAISFFTFTQIAYLVDSYRGETAKYDLLNYSLFVTFFPHLIAGPIVHHGQIMPQFTSRWILVKRNSNILKGLLIFAIGLFKKVVIADSFAIWADAGFDGRQQLAFFAAWATSLSILFNSTSISAGIATWQLVHHFCSISGYQ